MGSINPVNHPTMPPSGIPSSRPTPPPVSSRSNDVTSSDLGKVAIGLGVVAGVLGLAAILSDQDNRPVGPGWEPYPSDPWDRRPYPNDPWDREHRRPEPIPPRPYPNDPWRRRY